MPVSSVGAAAPATHSTPTPKADNCLVALVKKVWNAIKTIFCTIFCCCSPADAALSGTSRIAKIKQIADEKGVVQFYQQKETPLTALFGNFHPCKIHYKRLTYKNAEAAYQAAKSNNPKVRKQFCNLTGNQAWKKGQSLSSQGDSVKVMIEIVHAKFSQNPELKTALLATGKAKLVEHIPVKGRDKFWGDDNDGTGDNMLGQVLMFVRHKLGGEGDPSDDPSLWGYPPEA